MATVGGQIAHAPMTGDEKRVIFASSLGTVFEWYDFYLAGSLAAYISKSFFQASIRPPRSSSRCSASRRASPSDRSARSCSAASATSWDASIRSSSRS